MSTPRNEMRSQGHHNANAAVTKVGDGVTVMVSTASFQGNTDAGLRPTDQVLDPEHEPPIGAHIVTPRGMYTHHGIYVGDGRVVQYGGLSRGLRRGPVEEVSLSEFARRCEIRVRLEKSSPFKREEVISRARLRLGENRYHPLRNNCEHFSEWCVRGEPRSYQVDELTAGCARLWQALLRLLCRAVPVLDSLRRPSANTSSTCGEVL